MMARRLPDEREALEGATLAAANAAELLGDADLLAGAGRFGRAVSMAVLALEEAVKARTLGAIAAAAALGRLPGFDEDTLRRIVYSGHQARLDAGVLQHLAAAFPDLYGKLMLGRDITTAEEATLLELAGIAGSANAGKQAGFYTDFDPDSGTWSMPGTVSDAEFGRVRQMIGDFVAETQRQVDEFTAFRNRPADPSQED